MSGMIGANPIALREMAGEFDSCSLELGAIVTRVNPIVQNASQWKGADYQRFVQDWSCRHSKAMNDLANRLRDIACELRRNADEQDGASRGDGGVTPGSGFGIETLLPDIFPPNFSDGESFPSFPGNWQVLPWEVTKLPDFLKWEDGQPFALPDFPFGLLPDGTFEGNPLHLDMFNVLDGAKQFLEFEIPFGVGSISDLVGRVPGMGDALLGGDILHTIMDPNRSVLDKIDSLTVTGLDLLKESPSNAVALFGSAGKVWHYVAEQAALSDFSPEGVRSVINEINRDPVGSLIDAAHSVTRESGEIIKSVVPAKFHDTVDAGADVANALADSARKIFGF